MNKFKVGDRVAVYDAAHSIYREKGVVENINGNDSLAICFDKFSSRRSVWPQQCRRLVKKPRRRVWIRSSAFINLDKELAVSSSVSEDKIYSDDVEFVEVRRKKNLGEEK